MHFFSNILLTLMLSKKFLNIASMLSLLLLTSSDCKKVIQFTKPNRDKIEFASAIYKTKPFTALATLETIEDTLLTKEKSQLLFKIYLDQREYKKALELIENTRLPVPDESLAVIYALNNQHDKAAQLITEPLIKGIFFVRSKNYDAAIQILSESYGDYEDYRLFFLAKAQYNKNRWNEAKNSLLRVSAEPPNLEEEYYELLARCLIKTGQTSQAEQLVEEIENPALRLYLVAKMFDQGGQLKTARQQYWHLIKRFPGSEYAYLVLDRIRPATSSEFGALAQLFYLRGNYKKALAYLNSAKRDEAHYYLRGMIFYSSGSTDSALNYLSKTRNLKSYYWRGRIYEKQGQDSLAIVMYDSLTTKFPTSSYRRRALRRKGHLLEENYLLEQACSTYATIAVQFPQEKSRNLFRSGLLCYRLGQVSQAREIFRQDSASEFIYWQMRMNERLGQGTESLKVELTNRFPISYYTMIKEKEIRFYDSLQINSWLTRFADTLPRFPASDSQALNRAKFFFRYGELELAANELKLIKIKTPANIYYLAHLCQQYGLDYEAIRLGHALRRSAERAGIRKISKDMLPILYPIRYAASISQTELEPALMLAVIRQESYFNPNARSSANALGLMQIIPRTGESLAKNFKLAEYDLFDPECSIKFGTKYLTDQLAKFDLLPLALAAYNAGPFNVTKWLHNDPASELDEFIELIPFDETRDYVKNIILQKEIYSQLLNDRNLP